MEDGWDESILDYWFGELTPEDWFTRNEAVDQAIRDRFGQLYEALRRAPPAEAEVSARACLAAIIVLDQFPRNIFRGTAQAFGSDDQALRLARIVVEKGFDEGMTEHQRQFLYMPFMHSERLADQERGVDLFRRIGNEDGVRYAEEHRDIIARFGRFPHRNRVLGRQSTADERAFMISHEGYGQ